MKPGENLSAKGLLRTSIALLMISSMVSVYAGERDITQSHTLELTHTELHSQLANSDFGQSRNREEYPVMNQEQYKQQNQYKHTNNEQNKESSSAGSSLNLMNTLNHYMQGSAATGFINRQNTTNHSMSGGVIKVF